MFHMNLLTNIMIRTKMLPSSKKMIPKPPEPEFKRIPYLTSKVIFIKLNDYGNYREFIS